MSVSISAHERRSCVRLALPALCTVSMLAFGGCTLPEAASSTVVVSQAYGGGIRIRDIQGASHLSPKNGQSVANVEGIVTAKSSSGFYLQDQLADANPATSEGILVYTAAAPSVNVGDKVRVSGYAGRADRHQPESARHRRPHGDAGRQRCHRQPHGQRQRYVQQADCRDT